MAARGGGNNGVYIYRGEEDEHIPRGRGATHVIVDGSCTFVRAHAFRGHRNIVTLVCHNKVEKIERYALCECPALRRAIVPGVKIAQHAAFSGCEALRDVECGKLEILEDHVFSGCTSLRSINMPSAEIVEVKAFEECEGLIDAKFGSKLEEIERLAFDKCRSLERITIPLKQIITRDNIFTWCKKLRHIDLVEDVILRKTVDAF